MLAKIIGTVVSLLLVVGVIIGVVVTVKHKGGSSEETLSPQMKAVEQICQPTNFKDVCTETLAPANTTDPKELVKIGILAVSASLKKSLNLSDELVVKANNEPRAKLALDDCKDLIQQAEQELQATLTLVGESDLNALANRAEDFRTYLSSLIAYNEMCLEGFADNSTIKPIMQNNTDWSNKLTDNTLTIFRGFSDILKSLGLQINVTAAAPSRRLLQDNGYPIWMSAADRKLLASGNVGKGGHRGGNGRGRGGQRHGGRGRGVAAGAAGRARARGANAVVAQDGSGQFRTIMAAVNACPNNHAGRFVIYIKAGVYHEQITIPPEKKNILMYGDGSTRTIITGSKNFARDGINTWNTATVVVNGDGFIAKDLAMENTAGWTGHQALALRCNSDMSAFFNVRLDGYQDTLCYQAKRQFYRNCVITGTIDFIFGFGSIVIQNSVIIARKPGPSQFITITADGKETEGMKSGVVIHNCQIVPERQLFPERLTVKTYLGRPWKKFSTTVVMESELGDLIQPAGWQEWNGDRLFYAEYANTGPGANTNGRVKWNTFHVLNRAQAQPFAAGPFLQGGWIGATGVPNMLGFKA